MSEQLSWLLINNSPKKVKVICSFFFSKSYAFSSFPFASEFSSTINAPFRLSFTLKDMTGTDNLSSTSIGFVIVVLETNRKLKSMKIILPWSELEIVQMSV